MKGKYLLGVVFAGFFGAFVALFAYTRLIDKPEVVVASDSSGIESAQARALLASFQMQPGQVDFTFAAEETVHAVVHVRTKAMVGQPYNPVMEWFYGDRYSRPREVQGFGSGVIISSDGYIVTNNHVIDEAENIEVKLNDNRIFTAELIGRDPNTDLALLKIKADGLSYLKYGNSDNLRVGEWVLAVGNPFNLTSTVTAGIVSAKGRSLDLLDTDYKIESFIQTDAALNMGNSGGALVDTKGQLVGITTAIYSPSGAYAGNSFAVPVSIVKKVIEDLKEFGEVQRAILGVNIAEVNSSDAEKNNMKEIKGARIVSIIEGGSAADAKLKENDIITKVNGVPVNTVAELQEQVGRFRPGDRTTVTFIRDGKETTLPITMKNVSGTTAVVEKGMGAGVVLGARLESLSPNERRMYRTDSGVKIAELNDGRFKDMGLKKGTIILTINGKKVNNAEEVRQATTNGTSLKNIEGLQADGTFFSYRFGN